MLMKESAELKVPSAEMALFCTWHFLLSIQHFFSAFMPAVHPVEMAAWRL